MLSFHHFFRFAYQSAMKTAFSKFIIIILGNGKITVEVDTTQEDIYVYDPAWDNPVVKVNLYCCFKLGDLTFVSFICTLVCKCIYHVTA